jgi:catechol 2,3-dioxygenase-like lactoylglutathione lyase family enzyme
MMKRIILSLALCLIAGYAITGAPQPTTLNAKGNKTMRLGNFSVSLAVKDLAASRAFYEKLGFHVVGGDGSHFSILQNDTSTIGLFHGMFEKNILTFNPGWDRSAKTLPEFDDVREIQRKLIADGIKPAVKADESTTGPASMVLFDPDGNQLLFDQHVPSPRK